MTASRIVLACIGPPATLCALLAQAQGTGVQIVPTYEAAGIYWSNSGANAASGCEVRFRKAGDAAWTAGLPLWFDDRDAECRGSIVGLAPGTGYEVELALPGQRTARSATFRTWPTRRPVARTVLVPGGAATLNITEGGAADGYVVYQAEPGTTLDAGNASLFNVTVDASFVIVRGFTLRGARRDAIRLWPNSTDVVIEDNDISGWGRERADPLGVDLDSGIRAECNQPTLQRVTIQRNRIHDPRYGSNSWSDGHPAGPQAITFSSCGGNHVIRHNEIYSRAGHYFNDAIGGEDNFSTVGFPYADTDIYGNKVSHAWDDAIEAEGADRNVRIWGNYMDNTAIGIATTVAATGPVYLFRNVYNRSRELGGVPLDDDDRQQIFKAGSDPGLGDGKRYIFHNTTLQAIDPAATFPLGGGRGLSGSGPSQPVNNTVSMNNIYHIWRTTEPWVAYRQIGTGNEFANDLFNGTAGALVTNGINAVPTYEPGNGWQSEAGGRYALAAGTPGHDGGVRIPNFSDGFLGAAPDVGAHENGAPPMKFGLAASPGSSVLDADDDRDGVPNGVETVEGLDPLVKDNDIFGRSRLFVMQQYRDFLGREGDAAGIDNWSAQLQAGAMTRAQAIESFFDSQEFQAGVPQVTRLYFAFFNRIPDYAGLLFHARRCRAGVPLNTIAQDFAGSQEFVATYGALSNDQYVGLVYRNVLGRDPDPPGRQHWVNQLEAGMTRGAMMAAFSESEEFGNLSAPEVFVTDVYIGMLRRSPDDPGLRNWVGAFENGMPRTDFLAQFLDSQEYRKRFLP